MKGICVGKDTVTGMRFIFGSFGCKTMCNCVYNKTAQKQKGFSSFIVGEVDEIIIF